MNKQFDVTIYHVYCEVKIINVPFSSPWVDKVVPDIKIQSFVSTFVCVDSNFFPKKLFSTSLET